MVKITHGKNVGNNMNNLINLYNFIPAGEIVYADNVLLPKFQFNNDWIKQGQHSNKTGLVYLWVKYTNNKFVDIAYIGKAGRTLRMRAGQHMGGWKSSLSKAGENNRIRIVDWLSNSNNSIMVYARHSPILTINDEAISSYSIDEESFIKKFRNLGCDLWNFQPS
jgi:hypothetical protein